MQKRLLISVLGICLCVVAQVCVSYAADLDIDTGSPFLYPEYSKRISMDFQDARLVDVLKIFSQQTNLNLITSEDLANKKVTVYLDNVPVELALEQMLRANNLTYQIQPESNIYLIKQLQKPEVELLTRVYTLKNATVGTAKLLKTLKLKSEDDQDLTFDVDPQRTGILGVIKGIITSQGKVVEDPRTNSLIITDIATNFPHIEAALERLDVPVVQILIEVEMLEVTKETADKIGVKMGDTPLTVFGAQRDIVYPWNQNRLLDKGFAFVDPEYRVGTIDASGLSATLQFLRTQSDTKNLARPRILTLNNEAAQIKISTDEAIGLKTQTTATEGVGSSSVEAERVQTGVFLTVTPQANKATGEILMAVSPKVIIARTGATFSGTTFRDPESRGSQSILRVKSGDTVIIGGLLREDTSKTTTKVPILGDIPLIGGAFRHKDDSVKERELVIFLTPHILGETDISKTVKFNAAPEIMREQDIPIKKAKEIEKELSSIGR